MVKVQLDSYAERFGHCPRCEGNPIERSIACICANWPISNGLPSISILCHCTVCGDNWHESYRLESATIGRDLTRSDRSTSHPSGAEHGHP